MALYSLLDFYVFIISHFLQLVKSLGTVYLFFFVLALALPATMNNYSAVLTNENIFDSFILRPYSR